MIGLKNKSPRTVAHSFNGVDYEFAPNELKVLSNEIAQHLVSTTFTCALGASPLVQIAEKDIPAELLSTNGTVAPSMSYLINSTDSDIVVMDNGDSIVIPAKGQVPFQTSLALAILGRFTGARRAGLAIGEVKRKPEAPTPPAAAAAPDTVAAPAPSASEDLPFADFPPAAPVAPAAVPAKPATKPAGRRK